MAAAFAVAVMHYMLTY